MRFIFHKIKSRNYTFNAKSFEMDLQDIAQCIEKVRYLALDFFKWLCMV